MGTSANTLTVSAGTVRSLWLVAVSAIAPRPTDVRFCFKSPEVAVEYDHVPVAAA
jgi:hypothetical protein